MRTSAPGSRAGFTLLELLVVVAIVAVASAGVAFALRDASGAALERDAQRLSALLESARAQSRLTGQPVRWLPTDTGFRFEGLQQDTAAHPWLSGETRVAGSTVLVLGPEPVIGPQAVVLTTAADPQRALRVATDGLRPFTVGAEQP